MLLNAVRFAAKRKAKSIKMRMKLGIMRFLFDRKQVFCMAKSG